MTFAVYMPEGKGPFPALWYLSGLTCSHANVMDKGEYRRLASELGLMIICPDTSPRGDIPDEPDNWQFGQGAGFYVDATQAPYKQNYNMYSYIQNELPNVIAENFPINLTKQGLFGHSMGGHGALTIALKNPDQYQSVSAFAPIVQPSSAEWSKGAFEKYLGKDTNAWRSYDACALIEDGAKFASEILIDQGDADGFLDDGLRPWLFEEVCEKHGQALKLRMQSGYDHSYNFISTFMDDHLRHHAKILA